MKNKIKQAFVEHYLENGSYPASIVSFSKKNKMKESDFYEVYNSFEQIEAELWKDLIAQTIQKIEGESIYANYSVREKLLSFYYTLVEVAKNQRSYFLSVTRGLEMPLMIKTSLVVADAKAEFVEFATTLLIEGRETREIEQRPIPQLMQKYPDLLWKHFLSVFEFWLKDTSPQFEKTDTFIEKTVNTAFDLMGRTPLDSIFDLGKFMYQNRK